MQYEHRLVVDTSRMACGKCVCSQALTGMRSSRRHLSVMVDAYPQQSSRTCCIFFLKKNTQQEGAV
jgi:hypothetical protein